MELVVSARVITVVERHEDCGAKGVTHWTYRTMTYESDCFNSFAECKEDAEDSFEQHAISW